MTPTEVWEGFNPVKEPLETAIISSEEIENFVEDKIFFTSEKTPSGRVRVFADIIYDRRWSDKRAAIIVIPALIDDTDYEKLTKTLVEEGYVVCIFDYCGKFKHNVNKTTFPAEYGYAVYPSCLNKLDSIGTDARETPWFEWVKITRRVISVLCEHRLADSDRIGIVGFGTGAQIAWQTAGTDGRVRALVPVNGGGYLWCASRPRFTDENVPIEDAERAFSTGAGAETYAKFVTCPTCFITSSNSTYFNVDRAGDIFSLVSAQTKQLIISRGTDRQITKRCFDSLLNWLRMNFALDRNVAYRPALSFEKVEGKLYLRLNTDVTAITREIYLCYGEPYPAARYWIPVSDLQKVGLHEYTLPVSVFDPDELIVAYASVAYSDGLIASSPVVGAIPSKLGVSEASGGAIRSSKLIYNGSMGLGSFSAQTNDVYLDENVLTVAEGPCGIKGVSTADGSLLLSRSARQAKESADASAVQFDAYSASARVMTVKILTYPDFSFFSAPVALKGGDFWQKVLLSFSDFKSPEGKSLPGFENGKEFVFDDAQNVVINNMLWI